MLGRGQRIWSAQAALKAIKVEYEPLPGVFDPLEAMIPGANQVWSDRSNIFDHLVIEHGDSEKGFAAAEVIVDQTYYTPLVEHAFLEPECAIALVEAEGTLVVYSPGQAPHRDRKQIARALAIPEMIAARHGGRVLVTSDRSGTTFSLRMPRAGMQ